MGGTTRDFILEKVVPPLLSGVAGVLATIWRASKSLVANVTALQLSLNALITEVATNKTSSATRDKELQDLIDNLRLQIANMVTKDIQDIQRTIQRHEGRFEHVRDQIDDVEEAIGKVDTEMNRFIQEYNEKWNQLNRSLGIIEGYLKVSRKSSGSFPAQGGSGGL